MSSYTSTTINHQADKHKTLKFYVPNDFDPNGVSESIRAEVCYFLNLLRRKWWCWQADENGFVALHSKILEKIIPSSKHLRMVKEYLQVHGDLQICHKYQQHAFCKGYRITAGYQGWKKIEICDPKFGRKIEKQEKLQHSIHKHLRNNLEHLAIDMDHAKQIISTLVPDYKANIKKPMTVEEYRELILAQCQAIDDREFYFIADDYGRCHNNLSNLPSEIKECLFIKGECLVGLDLNNSQPLIAGMVARQFYNDNNIRLSFHTKKFTESQSSKEVQQAHKVQPYSKAHLSCSEELYNSNNNKDLDQYIKQCEEGKFYESLMTETLTRQEVKTKLYQVWFGKNCYKSPIKNRIEEVYPSVGNMLKELKTNDYQRSAWVLQNFEAMMFIGRIAGTIMRDRPEVPIITLHDAIYTTKAFQPYVQQVIMDQFALFNITPTISVTDYNETN
jgi:hypothetical protein